MFHKNVSRRILGHYRSNPFSFFATLMPLVSSRTTSRLNSPPKFLRVMMRSRCQCWAVDWWCIFFVWVDICLIVLCHIRLPFAIQTTRLILCGALRHVRLGVALGGQKHMRSTLYAGPLYLWHFVISVMNVQCPRFQCWTIQVDWVLVGILPMLRPEGSYVWHSAVLMWAEGLLRYMWVLHWVSGIRHRL